jgi:hypothetical protein
MKKTGLFIIAAFMAVSGILVVPGCFNDDREEMDIPNVEGSWDILAAQAAPEIVTYVVEVAQSGPSGTAQVSTRSSTGDNSGPDVVYDDTPMGVGGCGVTLTFSDTGGPALNLVQGDVWTVQVKGDDIYNSGASPDNTSTVTTVLSGGTYICYPEPCVGGLYQAGVPGVSWAQTYLMSGQVDFPSIEISQEDSNFIGTVPEIMVLSLTLSGHQINDEISVEYHRRIEWDGQGGDFFRTRVTNGDLLSDIEYVNASNMEYPDRYSSLIFPARSDIVRVDFIFGLSSFNDRIWLDELTEKVNEVVVFSDSFSTSAFQDDLAGELMRWEARKPSRKNGELSISTQQPLEGTHSVLAQGGDSRIIEGYILTSSDILSPWMFSGLGGSDGLTYGDTINLDYETIGVSNIVFSVFDQGGGGFYSSFAGTLEEDDLAAGTFGGEEGDHSCVEDGQFFAAINNTYILNVNGNWTMVLTGEAEDCGLVEEFYQTLEPFQVSQRGEWFSSDPGSPIPDQYGNGYILQGRSYGPLIYFLMGDYSRVHAETASFLGTYTEEGIIGAFSGTMFFESGLPCEVSGTYTLIVN